MNIFTLWLVGGVICIGLEALGLPGIGLLFAGLGAITVGGSIYSGTVNEDEFILQFAIFFITTALYAGLLWRPLKNVKSSKKSEYHSIIGQTAYVGSSGLSKHKGGEVTWSGTIMQAQFSPHASVDALEAGAHVTVVDVSGATLIVKPRE